MPNPNVPPFAQEIIAKLDEVIAAVEAQGEDLERVANYQRLMYETWFGADANSSGIWDGSDRYPDV